MKIQKILDEASPTALMVAGVSKACSAGLLIYIAFVNIWPLRGDMKLRSCAYVAVFIGAGGMYLKNQY
ncbi:hypothetical protein ISN45_Aa05g003160, partial [Arabidopsis thaliana x Arabidopsis arenosa]